MVRDDDDCRLSVEDVAAARAAATSWQLLEAGGLHVRFWGDEAVVFDAARAATHLLDRDAAAILLALQRCGGWAGLDEIVHAAAQRAPIPFGGSLSRARSVLDAFERAGLLTSQRLA